MLRFTDCGQMVFLEGDISRICASPCFHSCNGTRCICNANKIKRESGRGGRTQKRARERGREGERARGERDSLAALARSLLLLNVSSSSEAGQASMHALEECIVPVHFWMRCLMSRNAITESLSYFLRSDKVLRGWYRARLSREEFYDCLALPIRNSSRRYGTVALSILLR